MLQLFAFDEVGVVIGDIWFEDPDPGPGQEGLERGVRLELRLMSRQDVSGSIYASPPILIGEPLWRLDLLEAASSPTGSFDRTHHHPGMSEWEPGDRVFDEALSHDPVGWLEGRLEDVSPLLADSGLAPDRVDAAAGEVRASAPEILAAVRKLLDRVWQQASSPPVAESDGVTVRLVRTGWL